MFFDELIANKDDYVGKTLLFGKGIADANEWGAYANVGFKAKLLDVRDTGDDTARIKVSYEGFDTHNMPLEAKNYYDAFGRACLGPREAGVYVKEEEVYFMCDDSVEKFFVVDEFDFQGLVDKISEMKRMADKAGFEL